MADELPKPEADVPQVSIAHDAETAAQTPQALDTPQKDVVMSEAPVDQTAVRRCSLLLKASQLRFTDRLEQLFWHLDVANPKCSLRLLQHLSPLAQRPPERGLQHMALAQLRRIPSLVLVCLPRPLLMVM